ncbi:MAG: hypothetical protein AB9866_27485 [Syntrophobacteraceae bacterium]
MNLREGQYMQFSMEMVSRAEQLYCFDGHTLKEVSALTGVSLRALKRWSSSYGWVEKREEIGRSVLSIRTKFMLLREKLIDKCMETADARDAAAVATIESIARQAGLDGVKKGDDSPKKPHPRMREKDAVAALEKTCRIILNQLHADPSQWNISTIRVLKETFAFLRKIEANSRAGTSETSHAGGLSDETAAEIRRKILGIAEETGELERRTGQNMDSFEESNMQAPVRGLSGANDGL